MAKIDHGKMADRLLVAVGKKKPDADDERKPANDEGEKDEPGKLGKVLASALKHSDFEAIEEAVRNICGA
jgi:hypothetical protein